MSKIIMYMTNKNGNGYVESREYDELEDIEVRVGMLSDDVVLSFEFKKDEDEA